MIHTAFLGDLVIASGFLRSLRKLYPTAAIRLLTTAQGCEVLDPNPWNIELVKLEKRGKDRGLKGAVALLKEIRAWRPDLTINLHRYARSTFLALGSGAKQVLGFKDAPLRWLHSRTVDRKQFTYESERYHAFLGEGLQEADYWPELFFSDEDRRFGDDLLAPLEGDRFIVIAPSSVWATKRWPADRFGDLARRSWEKHGLRTVIVGSPDPVDMNLAGVVERLFVHTPGRDKMLEGLPLNLAGRTRLGPLKYILSRAQAVVANDSAPLHIGTAMGVPTLGIFGPTTKELGFFPLCRPGSSDVAEVELYCRPCGKHGHDVCPEAHFRCMRELTIEQVETKLQRLLCL